MDEIEELESAISELKSEIDDLSSDDDADYDLIKDKLTDLYSKMSLLDVLEEEQLSLLKDDDIDY